MKHRRTRTHAIRILVVKHWRDTVPIKIDAETLYDDPREAEAWVEEIVHGQLCSHVPPECLRGWYVYGPIVMTGGREVVHLETAAAYRRYAWTGAAFTWADAPAIDLAIWQAPQLEEYRV